MVVSLKELGKVQERDFDRIIFSDTEYEGAQTDPLLAHFKLLISKAKSSS
jgi:hypothetical protein